MASAASASLRSQTGYGARPASVPVVTPNFPALPTVPQLPAIDDARAPNAAMRAFLLQQLGPLATQNQANLTNIQAGAKLGLAGYGGWKFGTDDPATARREDLDLSFDPATGMGERERQAVREQKTAANARGMLESSFANQNIAGALQRLSLESQQVANQYAGALNQEFAGYAGTVSQTIGQYTSLYGQDAAWLAENPPPPPPQPPSAYRQAVEGAQAGRYAVSRRGEPIVGRWAKKPNMDTLRARHPGAGIELRRAGDGSWVAVLTGEVYG